MAIIVTKPVEAPTNLSAVVSAGGSLAPSTTYYYIVIAYDQSFTTCGNYTRQPFFSDISAEDSFVTTATDRTVTIYWDNATGATRYNIILTTTSGVYNEAGCGGYGGVLPEQIGTISDGTVGFEITDRSVDTSLFHSCQLVNSQSPHISDDIGLIWVTFDGGTHTLAQVYAAIVSAGYGNYAYYDGYNFVMKGWIYVEQSMTTTGLFYAENKRIIMLKGGIKNMSPEGGFVFRFGRYQNDLVGGNAYYGCSIDLQGARYTLLGYYNGSLLVYDCYLSFSKSRVTTAGAEWGYYTYFNGGSGSFFSYNISGFATCVLNGTGRSTTSTISDIKYGAGNNWPNNNMIRLDIWSSPNMPYTAGGGAFYACNWNIFGATFNVYTFAGKPLNYTNMYDCVFNSYPDGMITKPYVRFYVGNEITSDNYIQNHYSITFAVLDIYGNPVEGVNVSAVDGNGDPAEWIEQDGSKDRIVTGNIYTTNRTTDANGLVDYYLKAYRNYLNPDNTENIGNYSSDTFRDEYYPYTIIFSKSGWRSYSVQVLTLNDPVIGVVTLETPTRDYKELYLQAELEEDQIYAKV